MHSAPFHPLAVIPFILLVLAIAVLPVVAPRRWSRHGTQALVAAGCSIPVTVLLAHSGALDHLGRLAATYASFVATIGALYTVSGNIYVNGDLEAKPSINVAFVLLGAMLASVIGTTGASMLLIRPLLRTNQQRENKAHLVPIFILAVSNAGGLLTPLGDPPLLVGYLGGVPFTWTLRLFPSWLVYITSFALLLYVLERRAYAREPTSAKTRDQREVVAVKVLGGRNVILLGAIVGAALLPTIWREIAMIAIAVTSFVGTPAEVRRLNGFGFGPISEVAILFAGLFVCLAPIETNLAIMAPTLPLQKSWQLFWASGVLSSVLDNAPTYAAFSSLARGLSHGATGLVAGIAPAKLVAISMGSVVMGGITYIGNGPNLIVKAVAEAHEYRMPSFLRYAGFATLAMLPANIVSTVVLVMLDP